MKRDTNHIAFMNYDSLPKFQGSSEIDSSLYDKVFELSLIHIYGLLNVDKRENELVDGAPDEGDSVPTPKERAYER